MLFSLLEAEDDYVESPILLQKYITIEQIQRLIFKVYISSFSVAINFTSFEVVDFVNVIMINLCLSFISLIYIYLVIDLLIYSSIYL